MRYNAEMTDYLRHVDYKDSGVIGSLISTSASIPNISDISAVFGIIFTIMPDGEFLLLAIKNERGIDIPGGHVETNDKTIKAALSREINEEARILIEPAHIEPLALAKLNSKQEKYGQKILWFGAVKLDSNQVSEKNWLSFETFLDEYKQTLYKKYLTWILEHVKREYASE